MRVSGTWMATAAAMILSLLLVDVSASKAG